MITHFYSDPHYGHKNIIEFCERPFRDVEHMQREMITKYNEVVTDDDVVLWCGDSAMGHAPLVRLEHVLNQLNGRKLLVLGNHDKKPEQMLAVGFDLVVDQMFLRIAGRRCRVIHYPPAWADVPHHNSKHDGTDRYASVRPPEVPGEIIIHGHTHVKHQREANLIHVGVDAWDFAPASLHEVEDLIAEMPEGV
jgi:calcineurin-like phosphoesterase family protein